MPRDEPSLIVKPGERDKREAQVLHTGKAWDLRQAVAVMGTSQLGVGLSEDEVNKITDFLNSLTGDQPVVTYPILPPSGAATPQPEP
jgi:cytochrome c peroxidase